MSNAITIDLDADDLARICRALDIAADEHLARANASTGRREFTENMNEYNALWVTRRGLAKRLAAGR
jgi:hypothetical protein